MDKAEIIVALKKNHNSFIQYINELTNEEYLFSDQPKWTAGQQLEHIVLCVKPLVQVFSMDKLMIEKNFGTAKNPSRTYEVLLDEYSAKLKAGGKAPERYVPASSVSNQKEMLTEKLTNLVNDLCSQIENFTEEELDRLCIPHPLLGNITLREMMYNAICHVEHHHEMTRKNLENK
jgi:hypothetical protein